MKWLLTILGGVIVLSLLATLGVGFFLSPQDPVAKSDAIVAISGGETAERTAEAVKLFQENFAPLIIFSGAARDQGVSNAEAMKTLAVKDGVPEDKVLVEEKAQDTFDNARFVKDLLSENNIHSIILITSPYHQRRAYLTFRHLLGKDVAIINHSATDSAWRKNGWWKNDWGVALTWSEMRKIILLPAAFVLNK